MQDRENALFIESQALYARQPPVYFFIWFGVLVLREDNARSTLIAAAPSGHAVNQSLGVVPAAAGERLFVSTGCFACHRVNELGSHVELGGGDLSNVGRKRPKAFFARWLKDPSSINRDHRMPVFEFDDQQRADLAE